MLECQSHEQIIHNPCKEMAMEKFMNFGEPLKPLDEHTWEWFDDQLRDESSLHNKLRWQAWLVGGELLLVLSRGGYYAEKHGEIGLSCEKQLAGATLLEVGYVSIRNLEWGSIVPMPNKKKGVSTAEEALIKERLAEFLKHLGHTPGWAS